MIASVVETVPQTSEKRIRDSIRVVVLSVIAGFAVFLVFDGAASAHRVESGWQWTYVNNSEGWCTKAYSGIDDGAFNNGYHEAAVEAWQGCFWPSAQDERIRLLKAKYNHSTNSWATCQDTGWQYSTLAFRTTLRVDNGINPPFCGTGWYQTYAWGQVEWGPPYAWRGAGWLVSGIHLLPVSEAGGGCD